MVASTADVCAVAAGGETLSPADLWVYGAAAAAALLVSVYISLLVRGAANERVIGEAIAAMLEARRRRDVSPQRQLLRAVTETLAAQERAAARMAGAVHESRLPGSAEICPSALVSELLDLPEPQSLVTDFLMEYAGDAGSAGTFAAFAGRLVCAEVSRVYADMRGDAPPELDELTALAMEGRVAPVALAALEMRGEPEQARMPLMTDVSPGLAETAVRGLEQATRRQMRLGMLLQSQAAAILKLHAVPRGEGVGTAVWSWLRRRTHGGPHDASEGEGHGGGALRLVVHRLLAAPRLKLRRVPFRQGDLDSLDVVFDAIGEAMANAQECLAAGQPMRALYLLTGISVPVPSGLPGRIYNQDSLAQIRPLVAVGVWHRLAVCRWVGATVAAGHPGQAGLLNAPGGKREGR